MHSAKTAPKLYSLSNITLYYFNLSVLYAPYWRDFFQSGNEN
jgi:hypothetical protein